MSENISENTPQRPRGVEGESMLHWRAPEYVYYEKTPDWYWGLGVVAVLLVGFALWSDNFLFALIILLGAFTVVMFAVRRPGMVDFFATERGIKIQNSLYPYPSLERFWVHDEETESSGGRVRRILLIESKKPFAPLMTLPLSEDISVDDLRNFLLRFMEEEEIVEPVAHKIAGLLKF